MKIQIEFNAADFKAMITSFFAEAGFQLDPKEEVRLQEQFNAAFPDNIRVDVAPAPETIPFPADPPMKEFFTTATAPEDVEEGEQVKPKNTFSLRDLQDPTYSDDLPVIRDILSQSRALEREPR